MQGNIEMKLDVDDFVRTDDDWDSDTHETINVVKFLGIEVGRYPEHSENGVPKEFKGAAIEKRLEKIALALWALGDPDGSES